MLVVVTATTTEGLVTATVIDHLTELGFTRYEAQAYGALVQSNPQNGYELARASGVPRPNIYGVLGRLEERGAVMRVDSEGGTQFVPVASAELLKRLRSNFEATIEQAEESLSSIGGPSSWDPVANSRGHQAAVDLAKSVIRSSKKELLLAVWPQEAALLEREAEDAHARGVKVTTLCLAGCPHPCGHCAGEVYRYRVDPGKGTRWLVLAADDRAMLSAEVEPNDTLAVRTSHRLLVELAAWYIRHTIALSSLVSDLQSAGRKAISPQTRRILLSIGTEGSRRDWVAQMHEILHAADAVAAGKRKTRKAKI